MLVGRENYAHASSLADVFIEHFERRSVCSDGHILFLYLDRIKHAIFLNDEVDLAFDILLNRLPTLIRLLPGFVLAVIKIDALRIILALIYETLDELIHHERFKERPVFGPSF